MERKIARLYVAVATVGLILSAMLAAGSIRKVCPDPANPFLKYGPVVCSQSLVTDFSAAIPVFAIGAGLTGLAVACLWLVNWVRSGK